MPVILDTIISITAFGVIKISFCTSSLFSTFPHNPHPGPSLATHRHPRNSHPLGPILIPWVPSPYISLKVQILPEQICGIPHFLILKLISFERYDKMLNEFLKLPGTNLNKGLQVQKIIFCFEKTIPRQKQTSKGQFLPKEMTM